MCVPEDAHVGFGADRSTTRIGARSGFYAVIEYSSDPNYTNPVVSHEISEAASDPDLNAWFAQDGSDIGDICRFAYNNVAGSQVESVYSQKSCRCVRERDLASLDYTGAGKPMETVFRQGTWYGQGQISDLVTDEDLKSLRDDPRFAELLAYAKERVASAGTAK